MKGGFSMELHAQIKKYRANMKLSQEELADRLYRTGKMERVIQTLIVCSF